MRWASPRSPSHQSAALALAREAVAGGADSPELHLALARALAGTGKFQEAASVLREAGARTPDHESLFEELAHVLARLGEVDAALACARSRQADWAAVFVFKLLIRHERHAEAESLEQKVAAVRPTDSDLLNWRAGRCRDDPRKLLGLSEEVLSHDPGAAHAIYHKAVSLALLGRGEEASRLMGLDRYLKIASLPPPPDFEGEEAFADALRTEILANPTLAGDLAGHATRFGLRTRIFPAERDRAAPALMGSIREAIDAYAASLSGDHPFVQARPTRATLTQWALVFRGGAHQAPHHHPGCWLTGVYYVSARYGGGHDAAESGGPRRGLIRLGCIPDWTGTQPPWRVREVSPVSGTLLLFPSFVPHETVPPGDQGERISVAFDVTPVNG